MTEHTYKLQISNAELTSIITYVRMQADRYIRKTICKNTIISATIIALLIIGYHYLVYMNYHPERAHTSCLIAVSFTLCIAVGNISQAIGQKRRLKIYLNQISDLGHVERIRNYTERDFTDIIRAIFAIDEKKGSIYKNEKCEIFLLALFRPESIQMSKLSPKSAYLLITYKTPNERTRYFGRLDTEFTKFFRIKKNVLTLSPRLDLTP